MCGCKLYLALSLDEGLDHLFGDSRGRRVHVHPLGKVTRTSSETHLLTHSYDDDGDCDDDDDDDDEDDDDNDDDDDDDVDDDDDDVDDDEDDDDDNDDDEDEDEDAQHTVLPVLVTCSLSSGEFDQFVCGLLCV